MTHRFVPTSHIQLIPTAKKVTKGMVMMIASYDEVDPFKLIQDMLDRQTVGSFLSGSHSTVANVSSTVQGRL